MTGIIGIIGRLVGIWVRLDEYDCDSIFGFEVIIDFIEDLDLIHSGSLF